MRPFSRDAERSAGTRAPLRVAAKLLLSSLCLCASVVSSSSCWGLHARAVDRRLRLLRRRHDPVNCSPKVRGRAFTT